MIHIAVCDDNIDELSKLLEYINEYRACKNLNCEYAAFLNGFDLIAAIEKGKRFDIYCLDIVMPGFTGIDAAKEIRALDKSALIMFLTNSSEYALESYSVKAVNYVLKPITKDKLFLTFDEMLESIDTKEKEDAVITKSNEGIQRILVSNLTYAEVNGRKVLYHLRSGRVIECTEPFSSVCKKLQKYECFIKPHRSYIVNMHYVDTIESNRITLQTLSSVPVAQGRGREIRQRYLDFQMEDE